MNSNGKDNQSFDSLSEASLAPFFPLVSRLESLTIAESEREALDMVKEFLFHAVLLFKLDFSKFFTPSATDEFVTAFGEMLQKARYQFHDVQIALAPFSDTYPSYPDELRDELVAQFLSFFFHYGQRRGVSEGRRPYVNHTDEVAGFQTDYFRAFSPTVRRVARLHDTVEDFDQKNGVFAHSGFKPHDRDAFVKFYINWLNAKFPPVDYPAFFENVDTSMVSDERSAGGSRKSHNLFANVSGDGFREYAASRLKIGTELLDLSKLPGQHPGSYKDRYRNVLDVLRRIFEESDMRIVFLRLAAYMSSKGADAANNFISYVSEQRGGRGVASDDIDALSVREKETQMRYITQHFFLAWLRRIHAWIAEYHVRDAVRFAEFHTRLQYQGLWAQVDHDEMSLKEWFRDTFSNMLEDEYARRYQGDALRPGDWSLWFEHRDLFEIRQSVDKAIKSGALPETDFLHVLLFEVHNMDPVRQRRIKNAIEAVLFRMVPVDEGRSPHFLSKERQHPLIAGCHIRSDRGVHDLTESDDDPEHRRIGTMVFRIQTTNESLANMDGIVPQVFLAPPDLAAPAFYDFVEKTLLPLRVKVDHLVDSVHVFEQELGHLKAGNPAAHISGSVRRRVDGLLRHFTPLHPDRVHLHGVFGKVPSDDSIADYAELVQQTYNLLKEQLLTVFLPDVQLASLIVDIPGAHRGEAKHAFTTDETVVASSPNLPEGSNPMYALFYLFPELAACKVESIEILRPFAVPTEESRPAGEGRGKQRFRSSQKKPTEFESLMHLTLAPGDRVRIRLARPGSGDSFKDALSRLEFVRKFARHDLYPSRLAPGP